MPIESVMPSSHLILCRPLLLLPPIPPSIRVFSNGSILRMRWPKYWGFSFSISPSYEYSGLNSFRMDWLDLLAVQGTLKSLLQHHSSKASTFWWYWPNQEPNSDLVLTPEIGLDHHIYSHGLRFIERTIKYFTLIHTVLCLLKFLNFFIKIQPTFSNMPWPTLWIILMYLPLFPWAIIWVVFSLGLL